VGQMCGTQVGTATSEDRYCATPVADTGAIDAQGRLPVRVRVCEDKSYVQPGTLSFGSTREADFAVYQGSRLVWRWSAGRPPSTSQPHGYAVDSGECWTWWTTWRAVDSQGRRLHGDFVLRAFAYPRELAGKYRTTQVGFTI
ncbi:MAG: hypothetical protein QOE64_2430, partial [Frankiales bacterium]|nr:hypothetical protein [Frankiales bacterium]